MKIIVKNARLSFSDLFTPKSIGDGKPKFSATLICTDDTTVIYKKADGTKSSVPHEKMSALCDRVCQEKWGKVPPKLKNWAYNKADGTTTRDVYTNSDGDFWAGFSEDTWYISAGKHEERCKGGKLVVLDQHKQPIEANSGLLFSGCYVNVVIDVYAYENKEGRGITASLEGVQLKKTGEPLGITKIDASDDFDEEEIEEDEAADTDDLM